VGGGGEVRVVAAVVRVVDLLETCFFGWGFALRESLGLGFVPFFLDAREVGRAR
jgi:hypothetical protein